MRPEELLYAETHEWAYVQTDDAGQKVATIGISAFAVEALTDLVYMQLPAVGRQVKQGESIGEIESVKAVSDIYSPVDGEVLEVNSTLPDQLGKLSEDPYNSGWVAKIRVADEGSLGKLMDFAAYQKQCEEEGH